MIFSEHDQALGFNPELGQGVCGGVAGLFPNEASVLRLVNAILMETSEEWETGRAYLSIDVSN